MRLHRSAVHHHAQAATGRLDAPVAWPVAQADVALVIAATPNTLAFSILAMLLPDARRGLQVTSAAREALASTMTRDAAVSSLRRIRLLHTVVWAFFAASIVAIPIAAGTGRYGTAFALIGIVFFEVLVLLLNRWRCPLTDVAARYTEDRRENFDIYLPEWLARHNKLIFGLLYVIGILFTVAAWRGWLADLP